MVCSVRLKIRQTFNSMRFHYKNPTSPTRIQQRSDHLKATKNETQNKYIFHGIVVMFSDAFMRKECRVNRRNVWADTRAAKARKSITVLRNINFNCKVRKRTRVCANEFIRFAQFNCWPFTFAAIVSGHFFVLFCFRVCTYFV